MIVLPAIDLYEKKAVRLYKGDYSAMTVYSADPVAVAAELERLGAEYVYMVDLEGARDGATPNLPVIERVAARLQPAEPRDAAVTRQLLQEFGFVDAELACQIADHVLAVDRDFRALRLLIGRDVLQFLG